MLVSHLPRYFWWFARPFRSTGSPMRLGLRDGEANSNGVAFALLGTLCIHALLFFLFLSRVPARPPPRAALHAPAAELGIEVVAGDVELERTEPGRLSDGMGDDGSVEERAATAPGAPRAAVSDAAPPASRDDEWGEPDATTLEASGETRPGLSLEQLGVGQSTAVLAPPAPPPPPRKKDAAYYSEQLNRSLANSIARKNQRDGAGPERPVVTRLMQIAQRSNLPSDTSALLSVTADAGGNVVRLEVVSAQGGLREWQRIVSELREQLQSTRLRVGGGRGVHFTIRVSARDQLPSGADPGTDVSVMGRPVSRGKGQRPSHAELLNPLAPGNVMTLSFDMADIGATARRVVHAHLESLEVLSAPLDAVPAPP